MEYRTRVLTSHCGVVVVALLMALAGVAQSADRRAAEIGPDFQISTMGGYDEWGSYEAEYPAIAFNSTDGTFLVVWQGDEEVSPLVDDEVEIFGTVVTPGAPMAAHFRISDAGPDGDYEYWEANDPVAAYNSTDNEFMIAWYAPDDADEDDTDIYVSRYIPSTGNVTADLEVSDTPDPPSPYDYRDEAGYPDIVYNPNAEEYFVVYYASHFRTSDWSESFEIFGRRLDTAGIPQGAQIRISTMGPEPAADPDHWKYNAQHPVVAYNPSGNVYLVAWTGDTNAGSLVNDEFEIWAQLVDATSGALLGGNIRVSTVATDGDTYHDAHWPDVAANPDSGEFLIVWQDDRAIQYDPDVWGQRVHGGTGALLGSDFQISETLPAGTSPQWIAIRPVITYNPVDREYLVVWAGQMSSLGDNNWETWGQRLDPLGNEIGADDFRISQMGSDTDPEPWSWSASDPVVAFSSRLGEYMVVWKGSFPSPQVGGGDQEIFGQRLMPDKFRAFVAEH